MSGLRLLCVEYKRTNQKGNGMYFSYALETHANPCTGCLTGLWCWMSSTSGLTDET